MLGTGTQGNGLLSPQLTSSLLLSSSSFLGSSLYLCSLSPPLICSSLLSFFFLGSAIHLPSLSPPLFLLLPWLFSLPPFPLTLSHLLSPVLLEPTFCTCVMLFLIFRRLYTSPFHTLLLSLYRSLHTSYRSRRTLAHHTASYSLP